ncbi:hypothetical protein ACO1O0_006814 [Amphichorda felina]
MSLPGLPVELVETIAACLVSVAAINALSQTCTRFYAILNPFLYFYDDSQNGPAGTEAMIWALKHGKTSTIDRIIAISPSLLKVRHITAAVQLPCHPGVEIITQVPALQEKFKKTKGVDEDGKNAIHVSATNPSSDQTTLALAQVGGLAVVNVLEGRKTPLLAALENGCMGAAEILISHGADLTVRSADGLSPLALAAHSPSGGCIVEAILEKGVDPGADPVALLCAVRTGSHGVVELLVAGRTRIDIIPVPSIGNMQVMRNVLCVLADRDVFPDGGDEGAARAMMARTLLDHGADPITACNTFASCGPLGKFANRGHIQIVKWLLERGADANQDGGTPMVGAVASGSLEMVQLLVSHGGDVNTPRFPGRMPLLHIAVERGHYPAARYLLQHGVDINGSHDTHTALHKAVWKSNTAMVRLLLDHGAELNLQNHRNETPLNLLIFMDKEEGNLGRLRMLLQAGADPSIPDEDGAIPFTNALLQGRLELAEELLEYGHDVNMTTCARSGKTVLMEVAGSATSRAVQWLLDRGADINAVSKDGKTALDMAIERLRLGYVASLLLSQGAVSPRMTEEERIDLMELHSENLARLMGQSPSCDL